MDHQSQCGTEHDSCQDGYNARINPVGKHPGAVSGDPAQAPKDSRLDIYPAYNAIFEDGDTTEYLTPLIAFRVEFSPWEDR